MSYTLRRPAGLLSAPGDELARTIAARRFALALQPVVWLRDRVPDHAEALLRLLPPTTQPSRAFVAAAGEAGLGTALDAAVLAAAQTLSPTVSVNICARSLQSRDFVRTVLDAGVAMIELVRVDEIDDLAAVGGAIAELRAAGVRVALDDVDGATASLALLQAGRFDFVKLSGSVLHAAIAGKRGQMLLAALLRLAETVGARPIATKIETLPQLWAAERAGIELGQGWLLGAPVQA